MGLAEVVPGVSGATIALITGIYRDLVATLASFGPRSLTLLGQPLQFFRAHNLGFLVFLGLGMLVGVLIFARVMGYLLMHYQPAVWGFFCGVIAMSVLVIARQRSLHNLATWGSLGLALGAGLLWLPTLDGELGLVGVFVGGAIAICAWILPAVSGSYMLLALGLYEVVITAINALDWVLLATFAAGMICGLMAFVRILQWLLSRFYDAILALLTGFMLGSVTKLWPWQQEGALGLAQLLLPDEYAVAVGAPLVAWVALSVLGGMVCIWCLARYSDASL